MQLTAPADHDALEVIGSWSSVPGGLIPALHALQHANGFIDRALIPELSRAFNLSSADVHGVITFYKDFRTTAPRGPMVQVCRAEACQSRGARAVWEAAVTAAEGAAVEIEEIFCLGNCALGPAVSVDGRLLSNMTPDAVSVLVRSPLTAASTHSESASPQVLKAGTLTVRISADSVALAQGADEVAAAFAAAGADVVRTGSHGALWLEPLIEIGNGTGLRAFGPVSVADVGGVLEAAHGGDHPLHLGNLSEHPWFATQRRVTFARVGVIEPTAPSSYEAHGGLTGLRRALSMEPSGVVAEILASGLRGRGGAAFPAGIKLQTVLDAGGTTKYIVCNADEGDSGTFADRMLMEGDPFMLLEGMAIAAHAVGASYGYIYIRSEYPAAIATMNAAIAVARTSGWLGSSVLGSALAFDVDVRVGAGAYICGEETALLESLEGRRGVVRAKPPLPALVGLWGKPTVVNNVLTLATMTAVLADGAAAYAALGSGRSRGTQVIQLAGNVARGGILEVPFGTSLSHILELGAGTQSGRPIRTVQVGGPLGAYLPAEHFGLPLDYEEFAAAGGLLGHGGVVVFDDTVDMAAQARFAMEFCAAESCGKCTPCRIGSTRGVELIDKITAGVNREENLATLVDLCDVMTDASLCAMGGLTPLPVRSALTHFHDDFHRPAEINAAGASS